MGAISSKGTPKVSCKTNAIRSAGESVSSTTSSARPIPSASSAWCSGSIPSSRSTMGSGIRASEVSPHGSSGNRSRLDARERSMFRHTLPTTVVSHPPRFSTPPESERSRRSQASCTASSASLGDPSIL